jgi:DNA processing protein
MDDRPLLTPEERRARLELLTLPRVGSLRLGRLVRAFGSAEAALAAPVRDFERLAGRGNGGGRGGSRAEAERVAEQCAAAAVDVLAPGYRGYPRALEYLEDPPPLLFARGRLESEHPRRVAVVGSRRASAYGRKVARRLGRELGEQGCLVLSGMALGIDGEAHAGALEGGGVTLAVLGSGPDRPYPAVHRTLYQRIVASGGVISEHPPGTGARPHHFPRRNRILAGMADAVVVVEAAERSGALITADASPSATVFAVPGPVESPLSRGTFELLRDGAPPVANVWDLLSVMGWPPLRPSNGEVPPPAGLGPLERQVWEVLREAALSLDEIAFRLEVDPFRILPALGVLEVAGWVRPEPGGRFARTVSRGTPGEGGGGR